MENYQDYDGFTLTPTESQQLVRQRRLFSFLASKDVPPIPQSDERKVYPEKHTNIIYRMFFWWLTPMLRVGYKRTLTPEDMFVLDRDQKIECLYEKFWINLVREARRANGEDVVDGATVSDAASLRDLPVSLRTLLVALLYTFWVEYAIATLEMLLAQIASTLLPLLQKKLIDFVQSKAVDRPVNMGRGVGYAIGCCVTVLVVSLLTNHFFYRSMIVGAKAKAVLTKVLLEKSFRVDAKGHHDFPTGKVTSIMSTDLNRIDLAIGYLPFLVIFPFPVTICVVLLVRNIGIACLVGIAVFVVSVLLIGASIQSMTSYRNKATKFTDLRVNLIKELLDNFKIIKYYSWENAYRERLTQARSKEMINVLGLQNIRNVITAYGISLPTLASAIAFCALYAMDRKHSVGDIFSSLMLFQLLANQLMYFPMTLSVCTDFVIGLRRVAEFLNCGEVAIEGDCAEVLSDEKLALRVVNGTFKWKEFGGGEMEGEKEKDENVDSLSSSSSSAESISATKFSGLTNINFDIKKGEFVMVTGQIGSGKSSLLSALAGFMQRESGHVYCNGSLLLCGSPWVQNTTVRDNILFGRPFDRQKYSDIVDSCCLEEDFNLLPGGDSTEVGERGVTLSGGQKARINLARAIYADDDIILLDDILSAVDPKVGKKIMDKCIFGLLASKTRILVTHQLSIAHDADRIIYLNGDGGLEIDTVEKLMKRNEGFAKLMEFSGKDGYNEKQEGWKLQALVEDTQEVFITKPEERAVNGIKMNVYLTYLKQGRGFFKSTFVPIFIISLVLATFCSIFTNNWLSYWASDKFAGRSKSFYIGIYLMLAFLAIILLTYEFWMLVYFTNNAAKRLNLMAMNRLLHVPMSYVDTTPMGRIINRFTKDTDVCDNELIEEYRMFLNVACMVAGAVILCIIYLPWFAIAVPGLVFVFFAISSYYLASSREVKRLEAIQRSFVFIHFNESLGGMETVKSHKATHRFLNRLNGLIDDMNEAYFITIANQRWLSVNLDLVATAFSFIITLLCCFRVFNISAAATGLLLTYVLSISELFSFMLRSLTQIENQMNSVERLNHYAADLIQEAPYEIPEGDPPAEWPQQGRIVFDNVSMRYRPELPYVVKSVSLNVKGGERIGICGRTGSGKSTLVSCLFRMVEFEGKIFIDNVDISKLGLHTLRKSLSIIPQDPELFEGCIRENLDPFHEKSDDKLWDSLRRSGLIEEGELEIVKKQKKDQKELHKFHLDQHVEEDGINFSLGERQLIALARALVRESRILILDEATSNVDYETDERIQRTIAEEFSGCTILCIAHRLKTIRSYNRVVVMEDGSCRDTNSEAR
ncbi:DEKNAAC101911 [Brettanomyces naardenensis]|uniref:DEKNAAC101911 n=1 Tax=Brettanomyces naardenensis TaxID=13370 RepID=A0A448YJB3_BRENA|nr:DEKNAAC101911 [Brettanomyces naardenensis]